MVCRKKKSDLKIFVSRLSPDYTKQGLVTLKLKFTKGNLLCKCINCIKCTLDSELKFEELINKICNIVNKKLNVPHRIGSDISLNKQKMLLRAFTESQFSYSPLIWTFYSRTLNNKINRLHEKALRIMYGGYKSKFDELLKKDSSFSIHHRNIQMLAIEIFKFLNVLSPQIMESSRLNRQSHTI